MKPDVHSPGVNRSANQLDLTDLFGDGRAGGTALNTIYGAALFAPPSVKSGTQEVWGNVKNPRLEPLDTSNTDSDGWITVPALTSRTASHP